MQSIIEKLPKNWESELEYELLLKQRDHYTKSVYVCSPCGDESKKAVYKNMIAARFYMRYILTEMHFTSKAPHAYLPIFFSDTDYSERSLALKTGLKILEKNDFLFVCGNRITSGMRSEIDHAAKLGIPISTFHHDVNLDVRKIVTRLNASKALVSHEATHTLLAYSPEDLFSTDIAQNR